jgi:hypothetical protein
VNQVCFYERETAADSGAHEHWAQVLHVQNTLHLHRASNSSSSYHTVFARVLASGRRRREARHAHSAAAFGVVAGSVVGKEANEIHRGTLFHIHYFLLPSWSPIRDEDDLPARDKEKIRRRGARKALAESIAESDVQ